MELIQGTRNNVEQKKIEKELKSYGAIWPSSETCDKALSVFADCHLSHGLGILDALIGQMAVSLNLPLYTFNRRHYEALPGLQIIQPYVKTP